MESVTAQTLTSEQKNIANSDPYAVIALSGSYGCGKTTAALWKVKNFLENEIKFGQKILIFSGIPSKKGVYQSFFEKNTFQPEITTANSFAQSCINFFWPLIATQSGFRSADESPIFLSIETAQILMAQLLEPKIRAGWFSVLNLTSSNRLYNQVMIGLHKTAAAGLDYETYSERMRTSWSGDKTLLPIFDHVQECGNQFIQLCKANNFLDYSLQTTIFNQILTSSDFFQTWLQNRFAFFLFDNIEEETPVSHQFAQRLIQNGCPALLITDTDGGFRTFLGADPISAQRLTDICDFSRTFETSHITSADLCSFAENICNPVYADNSGKAQEAFSFVNVRQYPEMIKKAAVDIATLINQKQVKPSEIAIITPLSSDIIYTMMERELRLRQVKCYVHRPSRPLVGEPETKSLLTLCLLIFPQSEFIPKYTDLAQMLQTFIPSLDPVRGQILAGKLFSELKENDLVIGYENRPVYISFSKLNERVPAYILVLCTLIQDWIDRKKKQVSEGLPIDTAIATFYTEILAAENLDHERPELVFAFKKMIESLRKFRELYEKTVPSVLSWEHYFQLAQKGLITAYYPEDWFEQPDDAILVTLASSFLMKNRPVQVQIWLNAGSLRWWEKIYGPLTNDAVLSLNWEDQDVWDIVKVYESNNASLFRQIQALTYRCRKKILIYASETNELGQDQKSKLLYLLSAAALRRYQPQEQNDEILLQQPLIEEETIVFYPGITDNAQETGENSRNSQ